MARQGWRAAYLITKDGLTMTEYVQTQAANGSPGIQLPISDLAQAVGYTGSNATTFTVVYQGVTYVQTFTYSGSTVTNFSQWVPQP